MLTVPIKVHSDLRTGKVQHVLDFLRIQQRIVGKPLTASQIRTGTALTRGDVREALRTLVDRGTVKRDASIPPLYSWHEVCINSNNKKEAQKVQEPVHVHVEPVTPPAPNAPSGPMPTPPKRTRGEVLYTVAAALNETPRTAEEIANALKEGGSDLSTMDVRGALSKLAHTDRANTILRDNLTHYSRRTSRVRRKAGPRRTRKAPNVAVQPQQREGSAEERIMALFRSNPNWLTRREIIDATGYSHGTLDRWLNDSAFRQHLEVEVLRGGKKRYRMRPVAEPASRREEPARVVVAEPVEATPGERAQSLIRELRTLTPREREILFAAVEMG